MELSLEKTPAVFATEKNSNTTSDKYTFVPTTEVIKNLSEDNWNPNYANQINSRTNRNYAKHLVRFTNNVSFGNIQPEISLINGHDGTTSFRLIGGFKDNDSNNSIIIQNETIPNLTVRHIHYKKDEFLNASKELSNKLFEMSTVVKEMKNTEITPNEQIQFANDAIHIIWKHRVVNASPIDFLGNLKNNMKNRNLWDVYMKILTISLEGGILYRTRTNRRYTSRKIKNMYRQLYINSKLWEIAYNLFESKL